MLGKGAISFFRLSLVVAAVIVIPIWSKLHDKKEKREGGEKKGGVGRLGFRVRFQKCHHTT
jgi:hypothetical protein